MSVSKMHLYFLLLGMLVETTTTSPYNLDWFTSDLDFNSVLSDVLQSNVPPDDYTFTLPDPSSETPNDINMGNQIPLDETYPDINSANDGIPTDDPEAFGNVFNFESNSPAAMSIALLDPELEGISHAPDCERGKSIFCCDPNKEFFPAAVEYCIYCKYIRTLLLILACPTHPPYVQLPPPPFQ